MLLLKGVELGLETDIDLALHFIDRSNLYVFVPDDLSEFADARINSGVNVAFVCGHSFFTMSEFSEIVSEKCLDRMKDNFPYPDKLLRDVCIQASQIYPERIPIMLELCSS